MPVTACNVGMQTQFQPFQFCLTVWAQSYVHYPLSGYKNWSSDLRTASANSTFPFSTSLSLFQKSVTFPVMNLYSRQQEVSFSCNAVISVLNHSYSWSMSPNFRAKCSLSTWLKSCFIHFKMQWEISGNNSGRWKDVRMLFRVKRYVLSTSSSPWWSNAQ